MDRLGLITMRSLTEVKPVQSDTPLDELSQRDVAFVARKWAIPRSEAERMLKNQEEYDGDA